MDKISVIIPAYNAQEFITRCVNSILKQTYEELEIIIVDDGSTDHTSGLCRKFIQQDNRVRYIYQENKGPDYARKTGVQNSTGKYLTFVDADDYIEGDMIQKMYQKIQEYKCDIVCSQVKRVNSRGKVWNAKKELLEDVICNSVNESMYYYFVKGCVSGCYYAKLYRKEIFENYHFIENSIIGEDITAVLFAIQHSNKMYIMKESYYYYYWNKSSISHGGYTRKHYDSLLNYINVREKLIEKNYVSPEYVLGYFMECEMAIATAMSRNWNKDLRAITVLKNDIKKNFKNVMKNDKTALYMKACMILFCVSPSLFIALYRVLYLLTGR